MINSDNKRLSKALLISIVFHILLFLSMNLFDWFPVNDIRNKYVPLTVKIESRPREISNINKVENIEEVVESSEIKIPDPDPVPGNNTVPKAETASVLSASKNDYDPYADLGIDNYSDNSSTDPVPIEEGVRKTPYIPSGYNTIELEDPVPEDKNFQSIDSAIISKEESITPVVSDDEFQGLEQAISKDNNQISSESINQSESDSDFFTYKDVPVKFDIPGERRELLTNPSPEIPADLPSDFPPEITYLIRFSLNSDGLIKVLSITPSSVYPKIDASIKKALRSWTFKGSSDSELVVGTITLIFKGK